MTKAQVKIDQGKRLRTARERAGFETATEAAAALGHASPDTYIQHENGTRGYKGRVEEYARKFKVSPEWLLWGRSPGEGFARIQEAYEKVSATDRRLAEDVIVGALESFIKREP